MKKEMKEFPDFMIKKELYSKEDFIEMCQCGAFIDYDGFGEYSDGEKIYDGYPDEIVKPSKVLKGEWNDNFTHVLWYNR